MKNEDPDRTQSGELQPMEYEPPRVEDLPTPEGPTVTSGAVVTNIAAPRDL